MEKKTATAIFMDVLILSLLAGAGAYIVYRLFYSMNYKWSWDIIRIYLYEIDANSGKFKPNIILQGLFMTIQLSFWATLLAALIGFIFGLMRCSGSRLFFKMTGAIYVELIRNIPPLVLVFIFYFFISDQLLPLLEIEKFVRSTSETTQYLVSLFFSDPKKLTPFLSGVITIALFQGAYITEIVRSGIGSIDKGQWEAASALGMNKWQRLRLIILPQASRIMLPQLANEFINTIKYSSIVSVISIQELTFQGMQVMASTQITIEVWLIITVIYLVICLVLSLLVTLLEKKLAIPVW